MSTGPGGSKAEFKANAGLATILISVFRCFGEVILILFVQGSVSQATQNISSDKHFYTRKIKKLNQTNVFINFT